MAWYDWLTESEKGKPNKLQYIGATMQDMASNLSGGKGSKIDLLNKMSTDADNAMERNKYMEAMTRKASFDVNTALQKQVEESATMLSGYAKKPKEFATQMQAIADTLSKTYGIPKEDVMKLLGSSLSPLLAEEQKTQGRKAQSQSGYNTASFLNSVSNNAMNGLSNFALSSATPMLIDASKKAFLKYLQDQNKNA